MIDHLSLASCAVSNSSPVLTAFTISVKINGHGPCVSIVLGADPARLRGGGASECRLVTRWLGIYARATSSVWYIRAVRVVPNGVCVHPAEEVCQFCCVGYTARQVWFLRAGSSAIEHNVCVCVVPSGVGI